MQFLYRFGVSRMSIGMIFVHHAGPICVNANQTNPYEILCLALLKIFLNDNNLVIIKRIL